MACAQLQSRSCTAVALSSRFVYAANKTAITSLTLALLLLPAVHSLRDCLLACASGGAHAELPAGLWLQARFAREIALLKCCSDENIVSFLGASLNGDSLVLVMVSSSMFHGPQLWASSLILTGLPALDRL